MKNRKLVLLMMASLNIVGKAYTQNCFQFTPPLVELIDNSGYLNCIETPTGVYHNNTHHAKSWIAATSIDLSGINPYLPTEFNPYGFQANIVPSAFNVSLVSPADPNSVALWGKLEYGIALPPSIATEVNNFVNNLPGTKINPYLEWELKVTATFYHGGTTETRDGFYTKDYTATYPSTFPPPASGSYYTDQEIKDNFGTWTEQPTSFPFRVRFAPNQTGDWNVQFTVSTPNATYTSPFYDFNVVDVGIAPPIKLSSKKHYFTQGGKTFIPSGFNMSWPDISQYPWTPTEATLFNEIGSFNYKGYPAAPYVYKMYRDKLQKLDDNGVNFFRFIMNPVSSEIEFEKLGDYTNRLTNAYEMDQILFFAEQHQMYMDWNMLIHTVLDDCTYGSETWDWTYHTNDNLADVGYCYNSQIMQSTANPLDVSGFFTNPDVKKYYKQRLRYIVARWGYSPHVALFELFSEINNTGQDNYHDEIANDSLAKNSGSVAGGDLYNAGDATYIAGVSSWESEMADYLKNTLHITQLLSPSYAGKPKPNDLIYHDPNIDIRSYNHYDFTANSVDFSFYQTGPSEDVLDYTTPPYKPIIYSECDPINLAHCSSNVESNRMIWKLLFSGVTMGLSWYQMDHYNNYAIYGKVVQFMQGYDLEIGDVWTPGNIKLHNDGTLEEKNSWKDDMTRKDLKADLTYLRASDQYRAIGVITNRTWNYWTASGHNCGVAPREIKKIKHNGDTVFVNYYPYNPVVPGTGNNKLKVRGMKTKQYDIYYYDVTTLALQKIQLGEWGPELDLEYPTLDSLTPFVAFKLVAHGNTLPPEFVPNNQGVLAGQTLKRDSLLADSTKAPERTITSNGKDRTNTEQIKLYPNPSHDFVNIYVEDAAGENFTYSIINTMGETIVFEIAIEEKITKIDIRCLPKGIYQLHVIGNNVSTNLQMVVL